MKLSFQLLIIIFSAFYCNTYSMVLTKVFRTTAIKQQLRKCHTQQESKKNNQVTNVAWTPSKRILTRQEMQNQLGNLPVDASTRDKIQYSLCYNDLSVTNFIFSLPWGINSTDNFDLKRAQTILDKEHYGMHKTKDQIFDLLAIQKLVRGNSKTFMPVWCLVGPPGVGKTAICKSIALSMGKKYARIALGGVRDESAIRGWAPSYKSAGPGRIMQAIKEAGSCNPLITLDEIDKLSNRYSEVQSALLELMDPEQNSAFQDNYMGVPFDLSKTFFIATANYLENISAPLKDRMQIIQLSEYSAEDKINIAKKHLVKKACQETGLTNHNKTIVLSDDTLREIITKYTNEAGVRNLERCIKRLAAKTARAFVEERPLPKFSKDNLHHYLEPADENNKKIGF